MLSPGNCTWEQGLFLGLPKCAHASFLVPLRQASLSLPAPWLPASEQSLRVWAAFCTLQADAQRTKSLTFTPPAPAQLHGLEVLIMTHTHLETLLGPCLVMNQVKAIVLTRKVPASLRVEAPGEVTCVTLYWCH